MSGFKVRVGTFGAMSPWNPRICKRDVCCTAREQSQISQQQGMKLPCEVLDLLKHQLVALFTLESMASYDVGFHLCANRIQSLDAL